MSQGELGRLIGSNKHKVSRIEKGDTRLDIATAKRLAEIFDVSLAEILGPDVMSNIGPGFQDDAEPYISGPGDPLARLGNAEHNLSLYRITSDVLDEIGIRPGDVLLIDISAEAVAKVGPLKPVIAQVYADDNMVSAQTVIRQFVPPNLLITNSRDGNKPPLNMQTVNAHIKGVVVSWHRALSMA